jgi:hypothetical protein
MSDPLLLNRKLDSAGKIEALYFKSKARKSCDARFNHHSTKLCLEIDQIFVVHSLLVQFKIVHWFTVCLEKLATRRH